MFVHFRSKTPSKLLADVREKGEMFRERLVVVKQRILRNENFCPPSMQMTDSGNFISVIIYYGIILAFTSLTLSFIDYTY